MKIIYLTLLLAFCNFKVQIRAESNECDTGLTPDYENQENDKLKEFLSETIEKVFSNETKITMSINGEDKTCTLNFEGDAYWDLRFNLYNEFVNPAKESPSYKCQCSSTNSESFNNCMETLRENMLEKYNELLEKLGQTYSDLNSSSNDFFDCS